jgi:HlyD family secretion protein
MNSNTLKKYAGWSALAVMVLAALLWAFWPRALAVDTGEVRFGRFEQTIEQDGRLRVKNRYAITAPTAAELVRPTLRVGDLVEVNQPVATLLPVAPQMLDARTHSVLQERVGSAEAAQAAALAQLQRQQVALAQAELEAQRVQRLASDNFVSASARDQATLALQAQQKVWEAARAESHVAEHVLREARAALAVSQGRDVPGAVLAGRWNLRSPVGGRVIKLNQESAGPVTVGQTLLEIADTTQVDAVLDVLSGDAARVRPGARVLLTVGVGVVPLQGQVTRIEPVAFTKVSALGIEEQRVNLIVELQPTPAQQAVIGEGFRVDGQILVSAQDAALVLPAAALVRDGAQWTVFVVDGGRARRRVVQVRERNAEVAWLQSGVEAGAWVVLYPGSDLLEGQRLLVRDGGK